MRLLLDPDVRAFHVYAGDAVVVAVAAAAAAAAAVRKHSLRRWLLSQR